MLLTTKGRTAEDVAAYLNDLVLKLDICENWNHQEIHNIFNQYLTEKI